MSFGRWTFSQHNIVGKIHFPNYLMWSRVWSIMCVYLLHMTRWYICVKICWRVSACVQLLTSYQIISKGFRVPKTANSIGRRVELQTCFNLLVTLKSSLHCIVAYVLSTITMPVYFTLCWFSKLIWSHSSQRERNLKKRMLDKHWKYKCYIKGLPKQLSLREFYIHVCTCYIFIIRFLLYK